jgi:endoglucanase
MRSRGTSSGFALGRRLFMGGAALASAALGKAPRDDGNDVAIGPGGFGTNFSPIERWHPALALPRLDDADRAEWVCFRERFVSSDGRIIDTGNGGTSHSEGQGWGLLFAESFDDPDTFDCILDWTAQVLRRPTDALHAWRYLPDQADHVPDSNNATDGDLFIAGALARAALRWGRPDHTEAANDIARDVLSLLVRQIGGRIVLLPGVEGFDHPDALTVNLSYYAFALLPFLAALAPSPLWDRMQADGRALIAAARFGRWGLPPDWLSVSRSDGSLSPASGWPARFSYDAIRTPLHLVWAGATLADINSAFVDYWSANPGDPPAWVDLRTGAVASYKAPSGIIAVSKLMMAKEVRELPSDFPSVLTAADYYSAGLTLLSRLAWKERYLAITVRSGSVVAGGLTL